MLSHFLTGRPSPVFWRPPGEQSYSMTSGPVAGVVDWLSRVALPFGASSRGVSKARSSSSDLAPSLSRTASHIFSVDVEEYFHALALAPCAPPSRWTSLPRRVEA